MTVIRFPLHLLASQRGRRRGGPPVRFLLGALALALLAPLTAPAQDAPCEDHDADCFKAMPSAWEVSELEWMEGNPTPAMERAVVAQTDLALGVLRAVPGLAKGVSVAVSRQARYDARLKVTAWYVSAKVTPLCLGPGCEESDVPEGELMIFANDPYEVVTLRPLASRRTREGRGPGEVFGDYADIWHFELVANGDRGGMRALDEGAFIARGGRLPWKPVTQEAVIRQLISFNAFMADGERSAEKLIGPAAHVTGHAKKVEALKAELAALTPAERAAQAHFVGETSFMNMLGPGDLEALGMQPGSTRPSGLAAPGEKIPIMGQTLVARPVAAMDPTFFDPRIGPTAVQLLVVFRGADGGNNEAFERQVMRALDYRRLASLVKP